MDRYTGFAPCPCCFESSGYMGKSVPATWTDPGYWDTDYTRRCEECNGTGQAECEPASFDDLIEEWFEADEALHATLADFASEHAEGRIGSTPITSEAPSILHHEAANA